MSYCATSARRLMENEGKRLRGLAIPRVHLECSILSSFLFFRELDIDKVATTYTRNNCLDQSFAIHKRCHFDHDSYVPMPPPAYISHRLSIRWIPEEASEPTNTIVLTGASTGAFLDVRFIKETKTLDWAFAGYRYTDPGCVN